MKKSILILLAIASAVFTVNADDTKTCKVRDTDGTVEVSVYNGDQEKGTAKISFSNDTDKPVNIRYSVSFSKNGTSVGTRSGSKRVAPQSESTVEVSINKAYDMVKVTSATGEKCQ